MIEVDEVDAAVGTGLKVTCARDELLRHLGIVSRAASTRMTVQILSGILITAREGRLELAATDMELSLRSSFDAEVAETGAVVVPARLLVEIARLLPDADVSIDHRPQEGAVVLTCASATYKLHTYNPDDFPVLPDVDKVQLVPVDRKAVLETAGRVGRAASRDESRPVLTGVLVRFEPGKLVMAATDSYRLSVKETAVEGETPDLEAIVPARALAELSRIAQAGDELVLGVYENNQVVFGTDGVWLTTRRIDGQFPDHKQLLPETFEHELSLPREELLEVVRRTAVMAQRNAPLRLRFADGELTVFARTQDVGEATETIPVAFSGEPLEIGFNPDFLREGIESVDDEELQLKLISPLRPGLIRSAEGDFSYLIMPIRLAG
jgi:DNA polymerase III subunit beta